MDWNHFSIGGELCINPTTGDRYARLAIMDRLHGRSRSGPISDDQISELIDGLTKLRSAARGVTPTPEPGQ